MESHWVTHTVRASPGITRRPGRAQVNGRSQQPYAARPQIEIRGYLIRRPYGRLPRQTATRPGGLRVTTQSAVVMDGSSVAECSDSRPASRRSIFATMSSQER